MPIMKIVLIGVLVGFLVTTKDRGLRHRVVGARACAAGEWLAVCLLQALLHLLADDASLWLERLDLEFSTASLAV